MKIKHLILYTLLSIVFGKSIFFSTQVMAQELTPLGCNDNPFTYRIDKKGSSAQLDCEPPEMPSPQDPLLPSVTSNKMVTILPFYYILRFDGDISLGGYYSVKRKHAGSDWYPIIGKLTTTVINERTQFTLVDTELKNVTQMQYRIFRCSQNKDYGCISAGTTSGVNVSTFNPNKADTNGNGIRDDVDNIITTRMSSQSIQASYLSHYVHYLNKLVTNNYGPSRDMYFDFYNMALAKICLSDSNTVIDEVSGLILSSESNWDRFNIANELFGNSTYSTWTMPSSCTLNTPSSSSQDSIEWIESKKESILDQVLVKLV